MVFGRIESIKQPINQSFKSTVKETRIPLAIGLAVYPLKAEQIVDVTPTDSVMILGLGPPRLVISNQRTSGLLIDGINQ